MEDFNTETISRRSVSAVVALVSRSLFLNIFSYAASLVVFTYLSPKELGFYVAVLAIQRVISFFTDFGFGAAFVQKKDELKQEDLITSFTLQSFLTLFIFILVFIFKDIISGYFQLNNASMWLLVVLAFTIFLSSFKVVPSILLEREIKYHKLIIPQVFESVVFNLLLIFLVLNKQGINSYSWAFLASSVIGIPFYYYVSPWKLGIGINKNSLKHLKYGVQFQSKNILATVKDDFLTIFLTKFLPFQEIGYIGFGQKNAFFAYRYIVDNVTKVTFPAYSRVQENIVFLKKAIEKSLFYVSLVMFPVLLGTIAIVPYLINYFPKWQGKWELGIISTIFFCLNALVSSISGILVNVLDATGRVKTTLKLMILWTSLTWILTALLVYFVGYNGVSIASFLVTLTIVITIHLVKEVVNFNLLESIYKPFISSLTMGLFTYLLAKIFVSSIVTLLLVIFLAGLFYTVIMYLLARKELKQGIKLVFRREV